jgi:hypothetical protein
MSRYTPALALTETDDRVRLSLGGLATGEGATLQEAGDELVRQMLVAAMAARAGEIRFSPALRPQPGMLEYLWRLGRVAAAGGDIRTVIFAPG